MMLRVMYSTAFSIDDHYQHNVHPVCCVRIAMCCVCIASFLQLCLCACVCGDILHTHFVVKLHDHLLL